MSLIVHALFYLGVGLTAAVPSFHIDLDLSPTKRWIKVAKHYKTEMISMHAALHLILEKQLGKADWDSWLELAKFGSEYEAELQGMVDTLHDPNVTLDSLKMVNMLYELQSPTACAGVLWSTPNGTVMHGRNMDYAFHFDTPSGEKLNWPNVTFEATFSREGKPLFTETAWPGFVGIHTAMRVNGWGFQQNTRNKKLPENSSHNQGDRGAVNDWRLNLKAAKQGGQLYALTARHIMETTPHFNDAVRKLYATKFMAPQYFVLSGSAPFEGAVLTIDRLGNASSATPPIQMVSNLSAGWHLVQTNDDLLQEALDVRRPLANQMLSAATQDIVSADHLLQFMHTSPLLWNATVFSTVMVPATGFFKTVLPDEPPGPIERSLFANAAPISFASTPRKSAPVHRKMSLLAQNRHHMSVATGSQPVPDEVSLMQTSLRLEV